MGKTEISAQAQPIDSKPVMSDRGTNPAVGLFSHALNILGIPPLLGGLSSQLETSRDRKIMPDLYRESVAKNAIRPLIISGILISIISLPVHSRKLLHGEKS